MPLWYREHDIDPIVRIHVGLVGEQAAGAINADPVRAVDAPLQGLQISIREALVCEVIVRSVVARTSVIGRDISRVRRNRDRRRKVKLLPSTRSLAAESSCCEQTAAIAPEGTSVDTRIGGILVKPDARDVTGN